MIKKICVFCGSSKGKSLEYSKAAAALGRLIANNNIELVYGGGNYGLMGTLSGSVISRGGKVTGVIPKKIFTDKLINKNVSAIRQTGSMHERKALMSGLSDAFIVLPGGIGTLEEFAEVFTWIQLGIQSKPLGLLNTSGYYDKLLAFFENAINEGFFGKACYKRLLVSAEPKELLDKIIHSKSL